MIVHYFFEHPHFRLLLAMILSLLIVFVDKIDILKKREIYITMIILFIIILYGSLYNDYGIVLLLIGLIVLTFNNLYKTNKNLVSVDA